MHLLAEAASKGRLVVATVIGGDVPGALRRLLDMGADAESVAPVMTMAIGQRLVRTVCPNCVGEIRDERVKALPGVPADTVTTSGSGCPNCRKTGFQGTTGVFQVLLFNDQMRDRFARGGSAEALAAAAADSGMRPLVAAGATKVVAGEVSAAELDRVLRFSATEG
jgi:type II secretory ATPase GspE/PulE/Tfp pilus assembly ATPase PilB-like protein